MGVSNKNVKKYPSCPLVDLFEILLFLTSCCVDVVAAEHGSADCIIHFGHSCLSFVEKIPVFYVLEKSHLNIDSIKKEINHLLDKKDEGIKKLIVLYDVCYYYLYGKF